jgi:hypothetical protein
MLNKLLSKLSCFFVLSFLCQFLMLCNGKKEIKEFKDDSELNDFLTSNGYIVNTYGWKPGKQIKTIELRKTTKYSEGDFEIICSIPTLSRIMFDAVEVPNFTQEELEACSKISKLEYDFRRVQLSLTNICAISEKMKNSRPSFTFVDTNINDQMLGCLSKVNLLDEIAFDGKFEISEEFICKITSELKHLSFLMINESPFTKKALTCIFTLPNLKSVSLQNWSQVSGQEIWDLVHEYEDRHGRKLDAIIDDPTSIDSTVWPKNNN